MPDSVQSVTFKVPLLKTPAVPLPLPPLMVRLRRLAVAVEATSITVCALPLTVMDCPTPSMIKVLTIVGSVAAKVIVLDTSKLMMSLPLPPWHPF